MSAVTGILGRKVGMTQVFDEKGKREGVTVIEAGPCKVLQVKTAESDGYHAVQLGFADKREKNTTLPLLGHCEKAGSGPKRFIREIRFDAAVDSKLGDEITVKVLEGFKKVDVIGTSKGKGFQGGVKLWHFHGMPASHGCSKRHRSPGGLGRHMSINKGVPKGKKMAAHMGSERVTVQGLSIIKIDPEHNLLLVRGAVPGANGSFVLVRQSIQDLVRQHKEAAKKK